MDVQATLGIPRAFHEIPDCRRSNCRHKLLNIITIAMFAVIGGADGWVDVAMYGIGKRQWLKTFLDLTHGIPSHDTFGDVFRRLDPDAFERCFRAWMGSMVELAGGKLIAIDGKSIRRSFENGWDKSGMAHMVSAFVQANHMVFAQVKTDGKGQELSAIEKLLETLDLEGAVVTIDAIACNAGIAQQILDAGANYVLPVKQNQPTLHQKIKAVMDEGILDHFENMKSDYFTETVGDHGRIDTRKLWVCWDVNLLGDLVAEWPGLKAMVVVERIRKINGKISTERSYYISSLDKRTHAKGMAAHIRGHWSVENNLHWQLDISFREDGRRIRKGHGAENFSRLCRIALNLLKAEKTAKVGIDCKRKKCGWEEDYMLKVLLG